MRGAIKDDPDTAGRFGAGGADLFVNDDPFGGNSIGQFSAEAWVRTPPGAGSWASTDVKTAVGRDNMFGLGTRGWKPYAGINTPSGRVEVTGTRDIHDGAWHHLAMTYDGSSLDLYVDGEKESSPATGSIAQNGGLPLFIGSRYIVDQQSVNSSRFPGDIDEVAVYDHVIDASRFADRLSYRWEKEGDCPHTDAYTTIVCGDDPVGYWRFGETSQSQPTADHTGINDGGYPGFDQYGGAKVLLGQVNAVRVPNDAAIGMAGDSAEASYEQYGTYASDHFSVEGWVRLKSSANGRPRYLITREHTLRLGVEPKMLPSGRDSTRAKAEVSITNLDTGVSTDHALMGGRNLFNGKWHHLGLTYDGTTLRLFADGKQVDSKAAVGIPTNRTMGPLYFGSLASFRDHLIPGDIDEVAIYDHALSLGDMEDRFAKQRKRTPECAGDGFTGKTCLARPIGYWRLGETSGSAATDLSGVQNGTYGSDVVLGRQGATTDTGANAVATKATSNGYVTIPYEDLGTYATDHVTASAWVRTSENTGERYVLYRPGAFNLGLLNGKPFAKLWTTTEDELTSTTLALSGDTELFDGQWHHLALSYDGVTGRLVVDGNEEDAATFTGNLDVAVNEPIKIGQGPGYSYAFDGDIGDVALYDHALNDTQLDEQFSYRWSPTPECVGTNQYTNEICASNPIGYWRLDGGSAVTDFTGIQNGTYGAGVVTGKKGATAGDSNTAVETKAASDGFAQVPWETYGTYATEKMTAETWVKTTRNDGDRWALHRPGSFALGLRNGKAVGSFTLTGAASNPDLLGSTVLSDNRWHHIALSYDGSVGRLFVDGIEEGTFNYGGSLQPGINNALKIGQGSSATYGFIGEIDDVALYNHALSQSEMAERFALRRPPPTPQCNGTNPYTTLVCTSNPMGYWRLNAEPVATDFTGVQDGSFGSGVLKGTQGAIKDDLDTGVRTATTSTGAVTIPWEPNGIHSATRFTTEAWLRTSASTGDRWALYRQGAFGLGTRNGKGVFFLSTSASCCSGPEVVGTSGIADNKWHHVAATYDGSTVRLYVDGVQEATHAISGNFLPGTGNPLLIGHGSSPSYGFPGDIDEVAIYDHALTATEFQQRFPHRWTPTPPNCAADAYCVEVVADSPEAYWRLGETSGSTAGDEYDQLDGSITSPVSMGQPGLIEGSNTSAAFTGGDVRVQAPASAIKAPFSVEAWIHPTDVNGYRMIASSRWPGEFGTDITIHNGKMHADFGTGSGWLTNNANSASSIPANTTSHVVYTVTDNTWKLYLNGVLDASGSLGSGALLTDNGHPLTIGKNLRYSATDFAGRIDEVAVYPSVLPRARVVDLYEAGSGTALASCSGAYRDAANVDSPRANLCLGEPSGGVARDDTSNELNGTYKNAPSLGQPGIPGMGTDTAVSFNGTNQYVEVLDAVDPSTYTLETWVKLNSTSNQAIALRTLASGPSGGHSHELRVAGGKFQHYLYDGSTRAVTGTTAVETGVWYHVVGVATNGGTMKLYVNGLQEGGSENIGSLWTGGDRWFIGSGDPGSGYLNGTLDQVAIYPTALSPARIGAHYEAGSGNTLPSCASAYVTAVSIDQPRTNICLGEASGTTARDWSGNNLSGSYKNAPTLGQPGIPGMGPDSAVSFNGTNQYVEVVDAADPTAYTLETWVKLQSTADQSIIVRTVGSGPSSGASHQLRLSGGRFEHYLYDGGLKTVTGTTSVQTGIWYHVVGIAANGGTMKLYINGQQEGTATNIGSMWTGGDRWWIASSASPAGYLNGTLDQLAIYPGVISSARIAAHYEAGSGDDIPYEPCDYRADVLSDQPTGFWRLAEASGTTASSEVASTPGTGTYTGIHTLNQAGATADSNASVDLQGGHVSLGQPGALGTNSAWTVEAWVNPSRAPDNGGALVSEAYAGDNNVRFALGYGDGTNRMWAGFYGGSWIRAHDSQDLALNTWTHFVGTYNGSQLKLYRNGQLVATTNTSAAIPNGNETIYIGRRWDSSNSVRGRIDDVAVYPSALSAARIENHYSCATG